MCKPHEYLLMVSGTLHLSGVVATVQLKGNLMHMSRAHAVSSSVARTSRNLATVSDKNNSPT